MPEERLPWFPCEPKKLLGALQAMKPHVGYTYWIICLRIYEVGGPCTDGIDAMVRRTGYSKRLIADALDTLFRLEKLVRTPQGIVNPYAADVLDEMRHRREGLSLSGKKGANKRWGKNLKKQSNVDSHPIQVPMAFDAHLHLDSQKERKSPEANASAPVDERTKLFREGLKILIAITGKTESGCRTLIGGWLKNANDDALLIRRAIEDAERDRPAEPVSWIIGAIKSRMGGLNAVRGTGRGGSSSVAAGELEQKLRSGEVSIPPRPTRPGSILRGSGEAPVRLLPPGRRE